MKVILFLCVSLCVLVSTHGNPAAGSGQQSEDIGVGKLTVAFAWNQLTYDISGKPVTSSRFGSPTQDADAGSWSFPEEEEEEAQPEEPQPEAAMSAGPGAAGSGGPGAAMQFFNQYNNIPMGVDRYKDKIFITVPRRRAGIPSTLNYISLSDSSRSPNLRPYPDLAANTVSSSNSGDSSSRPLVSVYRTRVDACDRLWMVDTGVMEVPGNWQTVQPPAIVIYDLKTNTLLSRYELKSDSDFLYNDATGFASITVDVNKNDCSNAYAYLTDLLNFGLVVYSLKDNNSWRVSHNFMFVDPDEGDFDVNGLQYQWNDGVFSVALGPAQQDGFRTAYFHAMASWQERSVSTRVLRNETLATRRYHGQDFKNLGSRGHNGQSTIHGVHQSGVMFMGQVARNALTCWNTRKPLSRKTLGTVAQDNDKFFYPSDLKIDSEDNIWIMTNRLPRFIYSTLNPQETNFRIYRVKVQDAIAGTICA